MKGIFKTFHAQDRIRRDQERCLKKTHLFKYDKLILCKSAKIKNILCKNQSFVITVHEIHLITVTPPPPQNPTHSNKKGQPKTK